jgi:hypothetical protein
MTYRSALNKPNIEPLALPFSEACAIAGHGRDKGYRKLKDGCWQSFMDDGTRMVTWESLKADQARLLAECDGKFERAALRGQSQEESTSA